MRTPRHWLIAFIVLASTCPALGQVRASADPLGSLMQKVDQVKQELVADVIADIQAADDDAGAIDPNTNQVRDPIAHACYPAQIKFLQSLPQATPLRGKLTLVQLFQRKRDFVAQIKAGLPVYLKLGCAPLLGDEVAILVQTLGMVGVAVSSGGLSGILTSPIKLPFFGL